MSTLTETIDDMKSQMISLNSTSELVSVLSQSLKSSRLNIDSLEQKIDELENIRVIQVAEIR